MNMKSRGAPGDCRSGGIPDSFPMASHFKPHTSSSAFPASCISAGCAMLWHWLFSGMAISDGAIVALLVGKLRDGGMTTFSFILSAVCFAYLLLLSLKSGKSSAT